MLSTCYVILILIYLCLFSLGIFSGGTRAILLKIQIDYKMSKS